MTAKLLQAVPDTVTIVTINNPFDPNDRTIKRTAHLPGATLSAYVDLTPAMVGMEIVASINGGIVEDGGDPVIRPGNFIAVCPVPMGGGGGGKNILRIVAMVVLIIVANVYGRAVGQALGLGVGKLAGAVGGAVIMAGGSMLINAVLPPVMPDVPQIGRDSWNESPTYGWGALRQTQGQGRPIAILFGKMRLAGHELTSFVTSKDDKQYYNCMISVCDGTDPVSLSDIRINNQPSGYFENVTTYTRPGGINDTVIPGFDRIVSQQDFGQLLNYETAVTHQTQGNAVEIVDIDITAPYGIYYSNDGGGLDSRSVDVLVEYKLASEPTIWTTHDTVEISGMSGNAIRKTISVTLPAPGQYDIKLTRKTVNSTTFREKTDLYWSSNREIIEQALTYPGLTKYAITAMATDQLSGGIPVLSVLAERATVQVYNPDSQQWQTESATNPAWAYYALAVHYNDIAPARMLYNEISAWADYCDEQVDGLPRFAINIYLDVAEDFWTTAQKICQIGRARPLRRGSKYGVVVDMPGVPAQLFTMGNIDKDSFKLDYLPMIDRANAVEVTILDEDRDYTRQPIAVFSPDYDLATAPDNKASSRHFGCTNRKQAIRHAAFELNCNKYIVRTVSFGVDIDAIAIQTGDLFYFMHDAPNWGISGRVVSATAAEVVLDQEVTLAAGTSYAVLIRLADDTILDKPIVVQGSEITTNTLQFVTPLAVEDVPAKYDVYGFGEVLTYKRIYRLADMSRAGDLKKKLTGIEYNEAIYTDTGYVFTQAAWSPQHQEATHVKAHEFLTYGKDGSYASNVGLSWHPSISTAGRTWDVWLIDTTAGSAAVKVASTQTMQATVPAPYLVLGHAYKFIITIADQGAKDNGTNTATLTIAGVAAPPSDVLGFTGSYNPITRAVNFGWSAVPDIDTDEYEIRSGGADWQAATLVKDGIHGTAAGVYIGPSTVAAITYRIKAKDRSGNYSENDATTVVNINTGATQVATPTGLTLLSTSDLAPDGSDQVYILASWDNNAEASDDWHHYDVEFVESATGRGALKTTYDTEYLQLVKPNTSYDIRVRAVDRAGNRTAWTTFANIVSAKDTLPPATVTWPGGGGAIGGFRLIGLEWDAATVADIKDYRVQRSNTGAFAGEEIELGFISANFMVDKNLGVVVPYWYRVKARDTSGNESAAWSTVVTATTTAIGQSDIAYNSIIAAHLAAGEIFTNSLKSTGYDAGSGYFLDGANNQIIVKSWSAFGSAAGDAPAANADVTYDSIQAIPISERNLILKSNASSFWTYSDDMSSDGESGWGFLSPGTGEQVYGQVDNLDLKTGVDYYLTFSAKCTAARSMHVDLWPDSLPETVVQLTTSMQQFTWKINSLSGDIHNCSLRFFNDPPVTGVVTITDIILVESAVPALYWAPAPKDVISADTKNVNGTPATTIITGGFIGSGLVVADSIYVTALSSITANIGTVTAGRMQSANNRRYVDLNASPAASGHFLHAADDNGVATFYVTADGQGYIKRSFVSDYTVKMYNTAGTHYLVIPPSTGTILITVQGGGKGGQSGTGGGGSAVTRLGGSGGSKGASQIQISRIPNPAGETLTIVVGAGGLGGIGTTAETRQSGANGGQSYVASPTTYFPTVSASGGSVAGGLPNDPGQDGDDLGAYSGGTGGTQYLFRPGGGGGDASYFGDGGNGGCGQGVGCSKHGTDGGQGAGGGGGGCAFGDSFPTGGNGGNGGAGYVEIRY